MKNILLIFLCFLVSCNQSSSKEIKQINEKKASINNIADYCDIPSEITNYLEKNNTFEFIKNDNGKYILSEFFESITPAELSKIRGKRQETSTRDKSSFLKKVKEIEEILQKKNIEISLKKSEYLK